MECNESSVARFKMQEEGETNSNFLNLVSTNTKPASKSLPTQAGDGANNKLLKLVFAVTKPTSASMQLLLDRIRRNEETQQSVLFFAKNIWRSKQPIIEASQDLNNHNGLMKHCLRRKRTNGKKCHQYCYTETAPQYDTAKV